MFELDAFIIYALVLSFTPGPNTLTSMSNGVSHGYKKTLPFMLGVASGFFLIMMFSIFFNLSLSRALPHIEKYISLFGALFMTYLALKIMGLLPSKKGKKQRSLIRSYKGGFLMQFINPKGILYGLTIAGSFIVPHFDHPLIFIAFSMILATNAFLACSLWASFGSILSKVMDSYARFINLILGGLLLYSAGTIAGFY